VRPRTWGALGAGALGFACYHAVQPTSQLYGSTISRLPAAGRLVALTYDDGPSPRWTEPLLDLLDRHGARATFFVIGRWAERRPDVVAAIAERGHALGNHTFSHPTMPLRSAAALRGELRRTREAVEAAGARFAEVGGRALVRPPYGHRRPGTLRTVREEGYAPVLWSITCFDWRQGATAAAIARRGARAGGGDILLLHDGADSGLDADRSRTLAATEDILHRLDSADYAFVTVPELVAAASAAAASASASSK
jgi:peptidoglycan/xylan/chitin deacetylase (PgdA/CDA1 family)